MITSAPSLFEEADRGVSLLRNEPQQDRSALRLDQLLDAAAAIVSEIGYERLTTSHVAVRSNSSIGTIYRYFGDRIILLQALSVRNYQTIGAALVDELSLDSYQSWQAAVDGALQILADAFAEVPGFGSLRFGDVLDVRDDVRSKTAIAALAERAAAVLRQRFDLTAEDLPFHLEIALTGADAALARAFAIERDGDARVIRQARELATVYLVTVVR